MNADISGALTAYSFNDEINTIAMGDVNARIDSFVVTTDGTGAITGWNIAVDQWTSGSNGAHATGDRLNFIRTDPPVTFDQGFNNETCVTVTADSCTGFSQTGDTSFAETIVSGAWTSPSAVSAIATLTLSARSMIVLSALIMLFALVKVRRNRIV